MFRHMFGHSSLEHLGIFARWPATLRSLAIALLLVASPVLEFHAANAQKFVGELTLDGGDCCLSSASAIDTANGFAYFGADSYPAKILKIRLSDFSEVGRIVLRRDETAQFGGLSSAFIGNGYAYFATRYLGKIIKIRLSDFTREAELGLQGTTSLVISAVVDSAKGFAYLGTFSSPQQYKIMKIRLSDLSLVGSLDLAPTESPLSAVIDTIDGVAYFGTGQSPGRILKIGLSNLARLDTLTLETGEQGVPLALIDSTARFAYFVSVPPRPG